MTRMTTMLAAVALAAAVSAPAQTARTQTTTLEARATGNNEVPPVNTPVTADIEVEMDFRGTTDDGNVFEDAFDSIRNFFSRRDADDNRVDRPADFDRVESVTVRMRAEIRNAQGKTFVGGHIHRGVAGVNGPIVVDFQVPQTVVSSSDASVATTVQLTTRMQTETAFRILANPSAYYVNLHTSDNPGGEVRAQVRLAATTQTELISRQLRRLEDRQMRLEQNQMQMIETLRNVDENVAAIGRRNGLVTTSKAVVGSAN